MKYILVHPALNEDKFYQPQMNPKFWKDEELDPEIRTKLIQIANDFYTDLKVEVPIVDIQLTGSLANYNWTEFSDLDVHVILELSKINKDVELVKQAMDGIKFQWNQRHNIVLRGHDVELYAQDVNQLHLASGLYSLMKGEWIRKPKFDPPNVDPMDVKRKVQAYMTEISKLKSDMASAQNVEDARDVMERASVLKKKISRSRDEQLVKHRGEFSVENLVFKELRNNGGIGDLIDIKSKAYSMIYSEPMRAGLNGPVNEEVGNYGLVLVRGLEYRGVTPLFLFDIEWSKSNNKGRTTVGISNPRQILLSKKNELYFRPIKMTAADLEEQAGISDGKVTLNAKTGKTPLWKRTHTYTNPERLIKELGQEIRQIEDVDL